MEPEVTRMTTAVGKEATDAKEAMRWVAEGKDSSGGKAAAGLEESASRSTTALDQ